MNDLRKISLKLHALGYFLKIGEREIEFVREVNGAGAWLL